MAMGFEATCQARPHPADFFVSEGKSMPEIEIVNMKLMEPNRWGLLANFDIELGFMVVQGYKIMPKRYDPDGVLIRPPRLQYVDKMSVRFSNEVYDDIVERATAAYRAKAAEVAAA